MSTVFRRAVSAAPVPTLAQLVDAVAEHLGALVREPWQARLRSLAARLPFTDLAGFEARLGGADPQVDLIVRLPNGALEVPPDADPAVWNRILALCAERETPGTLVHAAVNVLDLEYDLPAGGDPASPAVFFELERTAEPDAVRLAALAAAAAGAPVRSDLARQLRAIVELLPPGARIIHLGAMLSRPDAPLRLVASRLPADALAPVAARLSGVPRDAIEATLAGIVDRVDSISLSFDVADAPTGRVAFEGFLAAGPERAARLEALLDDLVARGGCTPAERDALAAWPGTVRADGAAAWPQALRTGEALMRGFAASVIARFLSHVKWGVRADGTSAAKAYFGMAHYWRTPGRADGKGMRR